MLRRKPSGWSSFSGVAVEVGVVDASSEVAANAKAVETVVSEEVWKLEGSQGFPVLY